MHPGELESSFLGLLYVICGSDFGAVMSAAGGHIDPDVVRAPT